MLALCAYYEGTVPENQEAFDQYIESVHLPLVASYPRLRDIALPQGSAPRRCRAEILSVVRTVLRQPGRLPGRRKVRGSETAPSRIRQKISPLSSKVKFIT